MNENEFLKKLLSTFKEEAEEHVKNISSSLLELEKTAISEKQMELIETIFREVHSFKGAARAVNHVDLESICQALESTFAALKRKEIVTSAALLDLLNLALNLLNKILLSIGSKRTFSEKDAITSVIGHLRNAARGALQSDEVAHLTLRKEEIKEEESLSALSMPMFSAPHTEVADTIRIRAEKLQSLVLQAEELIPLKLGLIERTAEIQELKTTVQSWKKQWAKLSASNFGRQNQDWVDWNNTFVKSLETKLSATAKSLNQDSRTLGRMTGNLLEETKKALMLPFSTLMEIFPRLVRDLSRDQGKEVDLVMKGVELKIDRRILQEMKDPLIHLVRNCIDHGIEKPEQRKQKKKAAQGKINILLYRKNGDKVEIQIADDGMGVDLAQVKSVAVKLGMISSDEAEKLEPQEILSLLFRSGLTTSSLITDISGRGLGLAILKEKVEKLGGVVSVETNPNAGTTFRILLPLTLATFRGVLIRVNEQLLVLPTVSVDRTMRVSEKDIKTVENKDTITLNGQTVPLLWLADVLELPRPSTKIRANKSPVVVLGSAEKRTAFLVDEVLSEQDVLAKNLGSQLSRVRNIAGAAILGTGRVVNILNVTDLMKSALKVHLQPTKSLYKDKEQKTKWIVVAEDSITARTLLRNILESAGYRVKTAVDGMEAFTTLKEGEFDLVVSDVDMPRMNGFDLTAKIRADKKLSNVPVILVTALETREDRERGIDVGANAYIVKSSFEQSNLLEVIRRLV